jgi:DNA-binding protein Fis
MFDKFPVLTLQQVEKLYIEFVIKSHKGNLTKAARTMGIGRATIYRKVKEYGIKR